MAQSHRKNGIAYGVCDRCGKDFAKVARGGQPYKFCSRECGVTPVSERFDSRIEKSDGCWIWRGKKNSDGYGELQVGLRIEKAHRFAYRREFGEIPFGMEICHRCDNPACVRPGHLFLGSHSDNMRDMVAKGRDRQPCRRGEKHGAAKLTDSQAVAIRSDRRAQSAIAREYGVSQSLVSMIQRGRVRKAA